VNIKIDDERCQGHAVCYLVAPELFEVDDDGRGSVIGPNVRLELEDKAHIAVDRCPEHAVILQIA
jgi:ferredoxin